jgi:hypothetical protein
MRKSMNGKKSPFRPPSRNDRFRPLTISFSKKAFAENQVVFRELTQIRCGLALGRLPEYGGA